MKTMETKDRNDELMELKSQMELLKKELHKSVIVGEDQIAEISKTFVPKHRKRNVMLGALLGLIICGNSLYHIIIRFDQEPWWSICLGIPMVLCMMFMYAYMNAGNSFEIKDDRLILRDILRRKTAEIPIDKIRFIEFMANKNLGARIMYNKFDDFYLSDVNFTEIVQAILRINPDIEIRREMA